MAPARSTGPTKHITMHDFMKQQHLLRQRIKPTVLWTWPAAASSQPDEAAAAASSQPDEAAAADDMGGTWPPRSYTCAFCRREFRSAQALGGHMNVHRRDRAKMRVQYGAAAQLGLVRSAVEAPGAGTGATAVTTEYALLYPVLNSDAAGEVFMPSGDVLLSAPVALAAASHDRRQCHENNDGNDEEIDLELRLGWP